MTTNSLQFHLESLKQLVESSKKIVVLTGAGVSTDSGIPDFKTTDSLWKHPIPRHEAISLRYFKKNPEGFWKIYRELFELKVEAKPSGFHEFLFNLEESHDISIVTQNVDGLHSKAGSSNVLELHGSVDRVVCSRPSCKTTLLSIDVKDEKLPRCPKCRKILKPDVVLFDEYVKGFTTAIEEVSNADLVIVAGTSLDVNPFNELPEIARSSHKKPKLLWVNKTDYPIEYEFDSSFKGSIKEFLELFK